MRTLSVLLLVLLAAPAAPAQGTATGSATAALVADSVEADSVEAARLELPEPPAPEKPPPAIPTLHAFGATGLRVTLPAGWDGPTAAAEGQAESYALYTFSNTAADHPLAGTTLRVERVQGLNALLRERWTRGQTGHGYHETRPVGPAVAPLPGLALEVAGDGTGGVVVFSQRGQAQWAVQIEAPASVWAERRGQVLAVLAGVEIP